MDSRRTIWFVEDDPDDVALLAYACSRAGITHWRVFEHGPALQACLSAEPRAPLPALVVLDINLPMMNGIDVLRWLRERHDASALPIVMLSTSRDERDTNLARLYGADDYHIKPHALNAFIQLLKGLQQRWGK